MELTMYYTVERQLINNNGVDETTGAKLINLYSIENNQPKLISEIETIENSPYSTEEEIQEYLDANGYGNIEYNLNRL